MLEHYLPGKAKNWIDISENFLQRVFVLSATLVSKFMKSINSSLFEQVHGFGLKAEEKITNRWHPEVSKRLFSRMSVSLASHPILIKNSSKHFPLSAVLTSFLWI